jgi:hypothetical protein
VERDRKGELKPREQKGRIVHDTFPLAPQIGSGEVDAFVAPATQVGRRHREHCAIDAGPCQHFRELVCDCSCHRTLQSSESKRAVFGDEKL